ncbi:hypothetical protein IW248_006307 [Micromonospora ureilytica]|uniref:Uncharacterized protein n=1 Tax=Micromonospora ureilytica TaxID=709868 RepID=A0ABS0JT63_9ACTN|nr:hypothetical protein [Micromonospora ureilytica]
MSLDPLGQADPLVFAEYRQRRPRPCGPGAALVSVCRSPLGEWHYAAPAGRYSAKAI